MFNAVKRFVNRHKKSVSFAVTGAMLSAMSAVSCFAAETPDNTTSQVKEQFSSAISGIQGDLMGYILLVVPVSLAIFGAYFGIKKAIGFFKSMANKAN